VEKRTLGKIGFQAAIVGLGGIPIKRRGVKEAVAVIERALDLGVNYIDTARAYGDSEYKIGLVMKGCRQECFLATKTHAQGKREAAQQIETSLRNLQTGVIDLIQLHGDQPPEFLVQLGARPVMRAFRVGPDGNIGMWCEAASGSPASYWWAIAPPRRVTFRPYVGRHLDDTSYD